MPMIRKCSTNDYDIENDELYKNEELYEDEFNNGQNTIKCGEIILFKYNLLISCNYCEETLNNYDIFTKHLFEKHLNYDLNELKVNNDNDTKVILEEFTNDFTYSNNDLKFEQIPTTVTQSPPPNFSNLCYFNNELEEQCTKFKPIEEANYSNLYFIDPTVSIEIPETISTEIDVPGINNIVKETKYEVQQNKFTPMMGNSFKINSETYEEKFYKYCKLFKEKEANLSREHDKIINEIQVKSIKEEEINGELNSNKLNQQINDFIEEIPINIQLEESNDIFDDNLLDDIIEEDETALSFIKNHTENIDVIEETVSYSEHNHTENIDIDTKIEIKHETEIAIENLVKIQNNTDINIENFSETGNSSNVGLENQISNSYNDQMNKSTIINNENATRTNCVDRKRIAITAISTKRDNYYHCPDCSRYYTRFETLKIHYRSHTGEKNPYNCSICDKSFSAPCKLIQHQRVHTGERPYKCSLCPQAFKAKQKLKNHLESHQKGTIKTPAIYIDGISILERQPACLPILINNKFITSSEAKKEDGLYHCPICERKYRRFESLKEHSDIHVDVKQYECHICNKHFTKLRSLRVHLKSHTPNKNIRWNGTPISCNFCEKTFNNKYYLNEHLSVHSGKRPYECNICNKKFTFKSNFVLHERTHSGDKRYQCSYCYMKFVQSTTKMRHERVVHLKLPPFTCRYCQKGFYTLSIYKKHINDHKNNDEELLTLSEYKDEILNENDENNVIVNDNVEQTIIVDNNNEDNNIIVVEDPKISDFICSICGAYFVDCGQYIEHCKSHDNNINEQNIVHYMEDHIVGSEEIIV